MYRYGYHSIGSRPFVTLDEIMGIIFWMVVVSLVIGLLVHYFDTRSDSDESEIGQGDTVLDILKKRYVKGEISKKEFDQMKKDVS